MKKSAEATAPVPSGRDVYQAITDQIIAELERGVRPWLKPWNSGHMAGRVLFPLRHNGVPYRGVNVLSLWMATLEKGLSQEGHRSNPMKIASPEEFGKGWFKEAMASGVAAVGDPQPGLIFFATMRQNWPRLNAVSRPGNDRSRFKQSCRREMSPLRRWQGNASRRVRRLNRKSNG
ncbi:hypothetical protein J2R96_005841 [Bradyrhizobium elkanii]|nr:hypothetical protein [Bradyrhizobium elkanii]